ncbi:MAG: hypothetical protein HY657_10715 [Acidobacteria bacterium]|nr:hypothetical protein [Acidobacteriota bacterium]
MTRARALVVRVLVLQEGDQYLAQGIDYDLGSQAPSEGQAIQSFVRIFRAHVRRDLELGRAPLEGVPPAPERFFSAWECLEKGRDARLIVEVVSTLQDELPPAYVIHALADRASDLGTNR